MNFLNLPIQTLSSEEFIGSTPTERATWLCLMKYCAYHETGGKIVGIGEWGDRKLIGLLSVTGSEIAEKSQLWSWDGPDIIVWGYPVKQEAACQAKREAGLRYGRGHSGPQSDDDDLYDESSPESSPDSLANSSPDSLAITEGKGKGKVIGIGRGRGRERKEGGVGGEEDTEFDQFWKAYPKKKGKKAARKAWRLARDKPDLVAILNALAEQKKSKDWVKQGGEYIPHPATWLNQGRWEDEVTEGGIRDREPDHTGAF